MNPPQGRELVAPLLAAALLRGTVWGAVLLLNGPAGFAAGDTASYLEPGRNLLFRGVFQTAGQPEVGRTPGYPLFLALVMLGGPAAAALLQAALSVFNVWWAARLARSAGLSPRGIRWAAWLMALEPTATIYALRLLAETLFCTFLLVSLERMACFLRTRSLAVLAGSGIGLAAAIYVRPAGYYLPMLWTAGLIVWGWRSRSFFRLQRLPRSLQHGLGATLLELPVQPKGGLLWKAPATFLLAVLPILAVWQLRNGREAGFAGFSSVAIRNAYFYSAAEVQAQADGAELGKEQRAFGYPDEAAYLHSHPEQAGWGQAARLHFQQTEARRILIAHWRRVLQTQLAGMVAVAFSPCASDLLQLLGMDSSPPPDRIVQQGMIRAAENILLREPGRAMVMVLLELPLLLLYGLAVRGLLERSWGWPCKGLLLGTAFYFLAISGGAQAVGRFRVPIMPEVCVLAAASLAGRVRQPSGDAG